MINEDFAVARRFENAHSNKYAARELKQNNGVDGNRN